MNELNNSFKTGKIGAQQMAVEMNKLEKEMNDIKNAPQGFQEKMGVAYGKIM
jgi:FtsZ-binding cell division protein ZapB